MNPDKTPTDAEIMREADKVGGLFDDLAIGYQSDDILTFAMAVLAKWGSPVVAGESPPCVECDGTGKVSVSQVHFLCPECTTPLPTQAQAGAVALTDEQIDEIHLANSDAYERGDVEYESHGFARAVEAHHGIKEGGQHADS